MANLHLLLWAWLIHSAFANVEKTIFVAPAAEPPPQDASIDSLLLTRLSEQHPLARTFLNASFPTADSPKGVETWFLLEGLRPQRRYEVRICWLATQPTSFWLYTQTVQKAFETPELLTSLSAYSYARRGQLGAREKQSLQLRKADSVARDSTFLFLQVFAAADYFSLNETLMAMVPPIAVDVILDPYILNVFPKSLLPTGLYLLLIATGAWFLSGWISHLLSVTPLAGPAEETKKGK
ncbi:hypothetical protein A1O7_04552 [Cladophialophora yegresii CBS 114405]|uniref:Uncharacterized protein n=1 Tax=Cladophialophora yegresii CBS 114405 TaxID=1182544 RepID=W9W5Y0_9EURO|nr:uncharacterized protein A1O7_04552 [Cladophialophora yegresii CBS 114405]EXJ60400.1 hypothetical protein A1O7_04552 [Cladophialophora yegresii CBS 114405]